MKKNLPCAAVCLCALMGATFALCGASGEIKYVAHRGDYADAPEGSMSAYRNANRRRSEIVKLDVHESKDGVIVMSHDSSFKRTMGWDVKIADVSWDEIRQHVYLIKGQPTAERAVSLPEVLKAIPHVAEFWIDFKYFTPAFAEKVLAEFAAAKIPLRRVMVATYTQPALLYMKERHPEVRRVGHMHFKLDAGKWAASFDCKGSVKRYEPASETEGYSQELADAILAYADRMGLWGVNMCPNPQAVTKGLVSHLKSRGLWVSIALIHTAEQARRFAGHGNDAVVTRDRRTVKPIMDGGVAGHGTVETAVAGQAPSFLPRNRNFALAWSDEFDGDALDETKWSYRTNFWGRPAHWFAHPSDGTVEVRDGLLHMRIARRPDGQFVSPQLQTGEIMWDFPDEGNTNKFWWIGKRSPAKFQHRYGYWECRLKLQRKPGWWSAFWMQSENIGTTLDAADSGAELDMMESFIPGRIAPHNVFACGYGPDQVRYQVGGSWDEQVPNWEDWHVIGVLWDKTGYTFYVDGREDGRVDDCVSHRPHFLLLTTECKFFRKNRMTGAASPDLQAAVDAGDEFVVDYVRVWDEVPGPSAANGRERVTEAPRSRIGAVNWDCSLPASTYFGGYQTRSLGPEKYRDRTPYYAKVLGEGRIDYPVRTLAEYEIEMRHAIAAGIDYFAYCWYDDRPFDGKHVSSGKAAVADEHLHELVQARRHHLRSELRKQIGLCAILVCCGPYKDECLRELVSAMKDPCYETVEGRPLVYLFAGPWRDVLSRLNGFCAEAGLPRPYAVRMANGDVPDEDYAGIDAFGAYACTGRAETFARQCENGRRKNELKTKHGKPVIPTFSVGWDPSPRVERPVPWCGYGKGPYHPPATEAELCKGAEEFAAWMRDHRTCCVPGQVLVFAWNEFEEGGWICPNLGPDGQADVRRRDAFAKAAEILRR